MKSLLFVALMGMVVVLEAGTPGGANELGENHPRRAELIQLAERRIDLSINSFYRNKVFKVNSVSSQVVSGTMYTVDLEVKQTECTKQQKNVELANCSFKETGTVNKCTAKIWERLWLQNEADRQIITVDCKAK